MQENFSPKQPRYLKVIHVTDSGSRIITPKTSFEDYLTKNDAEFVAEIKERQPNFFTTMDINCFFQPQAMDSCLNFAKKQAKVIVQFKLDQGRIRSFSPDEVREGKGFRTRRIPYCSRFGQINDKKGSKLWLIRELQDNLSCSFKFRTD